MSQQHMHLYKQRICATWGRCQTPLTRIMASAFWACLEVLLQLRSSVRLRASTTMCGTSASLPLHIPELWCIFRQVPVALCRCGAGITDWCVQHIPLDERSEACWPYTALCSTVARAHVLVYTGLRFRVKASGASRPTCPAP